MRPLMVNVVIYIFFRRLFVSSLRAAATFIYYFVFVITIIIVLYIIFVINVIIFQLFFCFVDF